MNYSDPSASTSSQKPPLNRQSEFATPQPEYPHVAHDLNALSHYHLETATFSAQNTMGAADRMRGSGNDMAACYAAINEKTKTAAPFFSSRTAVVDSRTLNYDRISILFAYHESYYIVVEPAAGKYETTCTGVQGGFLQRSRVGTPLVFEWESLPKHQIGYGCVGLKEVQDGNSGWWHVYSQHITNLRRAVALKAEQLAVSRRSSEKKPSEPQFLQTLNREFTRIVNACYGTLEVREKQALEEMESAWKEFMVDDI